MIEIISLTSDEDIGASLPCNQVILQKRSDVEYAWKRIVFIVSAQIEIRGGIVQAIDNYGGRDF